MSVPVSTQSSFSKLSLVKWIVALGIPALICLIPVNDLFTWQIRLFIALSLLLILLVAFELFNIMVPSVLLPTAYFVTGIVPASTAFGAWTSTVIWVVLGAFVLANVLEDVGLLKRIAYWCILKTGGTYAGTVWGTLIASIVLSVVTFGNAYVLMAALCYGICKALGLGKSKEAAIIMTAGLLGVVTVRGVIYAPTVLSLINAGAQLVLPDFQITWLNELIDNLPVILFCFLFVWIMLKTLKKKPDTNGRAYFQQEYDALGPFSINEKKSCAVLVVLLLYLCTGTLHGLSMDYGFMIIPWLLFMPKINVGTDKNLKDLDLSMLMFIVACMSIGTVASALGVGKIVSDILAPLLGTLPTSIVLFSMMFMGIILNLLMTPLAILAGFSEPVTQIALSLGISPRAMLYALNYSCDLIILPYEYVPYLIFFSFGLMHTSDFIKYMGLKIILFCVFFFIAIIPYWRLLGLV